MPLTPDVAGYHALANWKCPFASKNMIDSLCKVTAKPQGTPASPGTVFTSPICGCGQHLAVNLCAEGLSLPKLLGLAQGKGFSGFKLDFANCNKLSEANKHPEDEMQLLFIQLVAEKKKKKDVSSDTV